MKLGAYETNRIYNVDCYEAIKQLPDNSIDLIISDPPYEIEVAHSSGIFGIDKKLSYQQIADISNGYDYKILDDFVRVLKRINLYVWCSKRQIPTLLDYFVTQRKCRYNIITWHKSNVIPATNNCYMPDTEYCLFFRERGAKLYGTPTTKRTYYVTPTNKADKQRFGHPTIKPLEKIQNFLLNSSGGGGIILDPFAGSGTTGVAAKNNDRQYILFEKDETRYLQAENRLNNIQVGGQMTLFTM